MPYVADDYPSNIPEISASSFAALQGLNTSSTWMTVNFNSPAYFTIGLGGNQLVSCGLHEVTRCSFNPGVLAPATTYKWELDAGNLVPLSSQASLAFAKETKGYFTTAGGILPTVSNAGGETSYAFDIPVESGFTYPLDPQVAAGYIYKIGSGDPNFASVSLPDIGNPSPYSVYLWNGAAFVYDATLEPNTVFNFGSGGVKEFEVLGIDPNVGLDPNDPTAFVTKLTFTGSGTFDGTMTPVAVNTPEPSTWAMAILGVVGIGFARRQTLPWRLDRSQKACIASAAPEGRREGFRASRSITSARPRNKPTT